MLIGQGRGPSGGGEGGTGCHNELCMLACGKQSETDTDDGGTTWAGAFEGKGCASGSFSAGILGAGALELGASGLEPLVG